MDIFEGGFNFAALCEEEFQLHSFSRPGTNWGVLGSAGE